MWKEARVAPYIILDSGTIILTPFDNSTFLLVLECSSRELADIDKYFFKSLTELELEIVLL